MGRTPKVYNNIDVSEYIKTYWQSGCRVSLEYAVGYSLPQKIEDILVGCCYLGSTDGRMTLSPNLLLAILATQDYIRVSGILKAFGRRKDAIILKNRGIGQRQAERYAIAARIASEELTTYIKEHLHTS